MIRSGPMMRIVIVATLLGLASACGPGRTAAATQPTPKAFDPSKSDAKSVEVVDALQAAIGSARWATVKQIQWEERTIAGEELKAWVKHSWDIWNGRHRCEAADMTTYQKPTADKPDPDPPAFTVAMYDLFDVDSGSGYANNQNGELSADDRRKLKKICFEVWKQHSYQLAMFHKLKDPGVSLAYQGQIKDLNVEGIGVLCKEGCDTVKVTFAPEVGADTWWVHVNSASKLPEVVENQPAGKSGRIGFLVSNWADVGGLKFPGELRDAATKSVVFKVSGIRIGDPDAKLYVPQVR